MTICAVYANIYVATAHGGVAQLGERTVRIRKVESSILFVSTKWTLHEHLLFQRRLCRDGVAVGSKTEKSGQGFEALAALLSISIFLLLLPLGKFPLPLFALVKLADLRHQKTGERFNNGFRQFYFIGLLFDRITPSLYAAVVRLVSLACNRRESRLLCGATPGFLLPACFAQAVTGFSARCLPLPLWIRRRFLFPAA